MLYLATPPPPERQDAYRRLGLGFMLTYRPDRRAGGGRRSLPEGIPWAIDNGCFTRPDHYTDEGYLGWLEEQPRTALWATAPDVLGDAEATLERAAPVLLAIRRLGFRAAFVAQDGVTPELVPWEITDTLFLGGYTEWKLGAGARAIAAAALDRGVPVHMGRVNSLRRMRYAARIGCSSSDGTRLAFGPDVHMRPMATAARMLREQQELPLA